MPIEFTTDRAIFRDVASVEEAESLLEWLQRTSNATVDLAACTHLHTANLQVLMAARPAIASWPENTELRAWLEAALKPAIGGSLNGNDDSRSR
jgi:hypothetical protein